MFILLSLSQNSKMNKTTIPKPSQVPTKWLLIDARDRILGRLASQVAKILMGKTKPQYTRHLSLGDNLVVINVDRIKVTGQKALQKKYYHYTGYPGGLRSVSLGKLRQENPERLFREAVWGMLPKNRLGRKILSQLHVYRGNSHSHQAQKPQIFELS